MDAANLKVQSRVKLTVGESIYEGIVLPQEGEYIVLKQSSGYNIGIHPKHITKVEELPLQDSPQTTQPSITQDESLPKITLLHTGGTIASKVDYKTGGVIASFDPSELLQLFPELKTITNLTSELVGNMQSENFRFAHFNTIAKKIFEYAKQGQTKFIVTCGTDFLHYLSSALSFILKDLSIGVLVVGAQRSSDRGSSDAGMNLVCAAQYLANTTYTGVGVCMHSTTEDTECQIIKGVAARKMHSSRRDAFKSINNVPIAKINYITKKITIYRNEEQQKVSDELPKQLPLFNEQLKVGMSYAHPQMFADTLSVYENYDGLVLIGSGLGHFPIMEVDENSTENKQIYETLQKLTKKIPVVMSLQTIYGQVHMNVYSPQRLLQNIGVQGHLSTMSPETTFIKLSWLLSNYSKEEISTRLMQNMVGELDGTSTNDFY